MTAIFTRFFKKHPFISNAVIYGSLYVGAELSQQFLTKRVFTDKEKSEVEPIDTSTLGRYAIYGTLIAPSILHPWYKWLDARYAGKTLPIITKKLLLDQFLMTPQLLVVFYLSMSFMEKKQDLLAECKSKFIPTFQTSCLFWLPAQTLNFLLIKPAGRVIYVGTCSLIWINILCWYKRREY